MTGFLPQLLFRGALYVLLGWYALSVDPFGISSKSSLASQAFIYRLIAPFYISPARDDILVLLLTEHAIADLHRWQFIESNEWPLRYRDHGYLLGRILALEPKALFVDVYFRKLRATDDSFPRLYRVLQTAVARNPDGRLFFAGNHPGQPLSDIQRRLATVGEVTVNGWDGFGVAYPLRIGQAQTTAYRMYRHVCLGNTPLDSCRADRLLPGAVADRAGLSVYWGSRPMVVPFPAFRAASAACDPVPDGVLDVLRSMVRDLWQTLSGTSPVAATRCPYHATLYVNELIAILKAGSRAQREKLAALVKNRIVMYGVSLDGLNDWVETPVHGKLPGVYLHAMTLDNLMSRGSHYLRSGDDFITWLGLGLWTLMALGFAWGACRLERQTARSCDTASGARESPERPCFEQWCRSPWSSLRRTIRLYPRASMFLAGSLLVVIVGLALFLVWHYEPVNSLGFISLLGVISLLRDSRLEHALENRLLNAGRWLKRRFASRNAP